MHLFMQQRHSIPNNLLSALSHLQHFDKAALALMQWCSAVR
jgi:hypothetical protein